MPLPLLFLRGGRYDGSNRRVFVSALFAPDCGSTCHDYTEQTIWDGDQVLGEIRTGGGFQQSGTIAYTHGGGLDAPLSLVRKGLTSGPVTIVPHSNWRGQYHAGSYTDGAVAGNSRLDLREVRWPAENAGAYLNPLRPFRRDAPWMGSLVQSSEDASGLMYRRNRYYDPKTGRFTQEDPIGLAGGLNTYGFADGDPVSYEDPYGLCVDGVSTIACLYAAFEVASTLYDIGDLAVTGYRYTRGRVSGRELAVTAGGVAAGVVLFGGGYGSGARQLSRRLPFRDSDRLIEINRTLDRIEDGVKKFRQDGTTFRNREGKLPAKADGYYREWTVETPGASNRGARRVVQGQGGETYYTDDHYGSFIRVDARKQ